VAINQNNAPTNPYDYYKEVYGPEYASEFTKSYGDKEITKVIKVKSPKQVSTPKSK